MKQIKNKENNTNKKSPIKLFVSDIDGTMTDGGVYYSIHGEEMVKFNRRDGAAFPQLHQAGIETLVMSGEDNNCNRRRCEKLNITYTLLGIINKLERLENFLLTHKIDANEVAYIGDDVNDFECLSNVGLAGCPWDAADAIKDIKEIYICACKGGYGAVREFAEYTLYYNDSFKYKPGSIGTWRNDFGKQ